MTKAQRSYLIGHGIYPEGLEWHDAIDLGFERFGRSEAAILPDGRVLLANGSPEFRDSQATKED